jgi:hypothetical protein
MQSRTQHSVASPEDISPDELFGHGEGHSQAAIEPTLNAILYVVHKSVTPTQNRSRTPPIPWKTILVVLAASAVIAWVAGFLAGLIVRFAVRTW